MNSTYACSISLAIRFQCSAVMSEESISGSYLNIAVMVKICQVEWTRMTHSVIWNAGIESRFISGIAFICSVRYPGTGARLPSCCCFIPIVPPLPKANAKLGKRKNLCNPVHLRIDYQHTPMIGKLPSLCCY